jgi:CHAT domain-containing protein
VIFADPDFTMTLSRKSPRELDREIRGLPDLGSFIWSPLPGTGKEAENIAKILAPEPVILFSGKNALKSEMMNLSAPRRLHIATHGFFLKQTEDPEDPPDGRGKAVMAGEQRLVPPLQFENLLLRSGLVFAGAHSPGPDTFSRGIMTALEVSTLNLRGTDLVVLSACETGCGKSLPGEGVFGLRRSFQLAGARTVVMSLWSVPDEETQQLMTLFYRNLKGGDRKSAALRNAALAMIKERREKHGAAHPFFWASFISVGE